MCVIVIATWENIRLQVLHIIVILWFNEDILD